MPMMYTSPKKFRKVHHNAYISNESLQCPSMTLAQPVRNLLKGETEMILRKDGSGREKADVWMNYGYIYWFTIYFC